MSQGIDRFPSSLTLIVFAVLVALLTGFLILLSAVSVRVGLSYPAQPGSWLPIILGIVAGALTAFLFYRFVRWFFHRIYPQKTVNL